MDDAFRVAQLAMMLSSDWPKNPPQVLYVPGLSRGMLEASTILDNAAVLYDHSDLECIAFNGGDGSPFGKDAPGTSWPGKDFYLAELTRLGVPRNRLIPTGPAAHTREEMDQLILTAKERKWKRIGILTIPYHYPRAFAYLPEPMRVHAWRPDVFALTPATTNWYLPMGASQGNGVTTPEEAALDDAKKLLEHIKNGWAASLDEVFKYLELRDK